MAKQVTGEAKFQVPGGQATPAPPVGTSLGKFGINLGQFVQQFNDRTKEYAGTPIPVVVTVYNDRTFEFVTKSPPAASMLKIAAGIARPECTKSFSLIFVFLDTPKSKFPVRFARHHITPKPFNCFHDLSKETNL